MTGPVNKNILKNMWIVTAQPPVLYTRPPMKQTSFTYKLTETQARELHALLKQSNYRPIQVPYTLIAVEANDCRVNLYESRKCLVQGKGAEEFITFVLEPEILHEARLGYEDILNPQAIQPHMGVDESGKGDFFGPLVIAAAYIDPASAALFKKIGVKDSKAIKSDQKAQDMAKEIRSACQGRFALVAIGPEAYNRLYTTMRSVNTILAWGHARAIENLLEKVPDCPMALSDQFGPTRQIQQALLKKGRAIELQQMPRAEADPAVAAASILARAGFLSALKKMSEQFGIDIPKGASAHVREIAGTLLDRHEPDVLLKTVKCHFKTTDEVLASRGLTRSALGPNGQAVSKALTDKKKG